MNKIQKHIEIVRCNRGGLISVGRKAAVSVQNVLLQHYETVNISIVNNLVELNALVAKQPDLVLLGMKFLPDVESGSEPIWVSRYLEQHDIAHTGSRQPAIELECNKLLAKRQVIEAGLKTAHYESVNRLDTSLNNNRVLQYPLFVKPTSLGGGIGIDGNSVVRNLPELRAKVQSILQNYNSDVMIEEYLSGREFSVAILKQESNSELLAMPIELVAQPNSLGDRILAHEVKKADIEQVLFVEDQHLRSIIGEFAKDVFVALGARDYGRIDIRLDSQGTPHFLEANLVPGLGAKNCYFSRACRLNGIISYEEFIMTIVSLALTRSSSTIIEESLHLMPDFLNPDPLIQIA